MPAIHPLQSLHHQVKWDDNDDDRHHLGSQHAKHKMLFPGNRQAYQRIGCTGASKNTDQGDRCADDQAAGQGAHEFVSGNGDGLPWFRTKNQGFKPAEGWFFWDPVRWGNSQFFGW